MFEWITQCHAAELIANVFFFGKVSFAYGWPLMFNVMSHCFTI